MFNILFQLKSISKDQNGLVVQPNDNMVIYSTVYDNEDTTELSDVNETPHPPEWSGGRDTTANGVEDSYEDTTANVPEDTIANGVDDTTANVGEDTKASAAEDTTANGVEDTTGSEDIDTTANEVEDTTSENGLWGGRWPETTASENIDTTTNEVEDKTAVSGANSRNIFKSKCVFVFIFHL